MCEPRVSCETSDGESFPPAPPRGAIRASHRCLASHRALHRCPQSNGLISIRTAGAEGFEGLGRLAAEQHKAVGIGRPWITWSPGGASVLGPGSVASGQRMHGALGSGGLCDVLACPLPAQPCGRGSESELGALIFL